MTRTPAAVAWMFIAVAMAALLWAVVAYGPWSGLPPLDERVAPMRGGR